MLLFALPAFTYPALCQLYDILPQQDVLWSGWGGIHAGSDIHTLALVPAVRLGGMGDSCIVVFTFGPFLGKVGGKGGIPKYPRQFTYQIEEFFRYTF